MFFFSLSWFSVVDVVGHLPRAHLDDARPRRGRRPSDPARRPSPDHGLLFLRADVLDSVLALLSLHVDLKGKDNHGDGETGQRGDEHAAQRAERDT